MKNDHRGSQELERARTSRIIATVSRRDKARWTRTAQARGLGLIAWMVATLNAAADPFPDDPPSGK